MRPPPPTPRLRFREMVDADLDDVAALLGDPVVMRHYPAPKSREEAAAWIAWTRSSYAEHGFGLWVLETHDGEFVGDCGLTMQTVDGEALVEVGYHVRADRQDRGLATEAATAVRDAARRAGVAHLVAIIAPENLASRRVAEKVGLRLERRTTRSGLPVLVYAGYL